MMSNNLSFEVGNKIKIKETQFKVEGYITFKGQDGSRWTEYRLKSLDNYQVVWLSIDYQYNEYAIYTEYPYSNDFLEENIRANGYKKVEDSIATVAGYKGNVDVDFGETVYYKEYEDSTEELISIENWDGEQEYSKGYYIDGNFIKKLTTSYNESYISTSVYNTDYLSSSNLKKIAIIAIVIVAALFLTLCSLGGTPKEALAKYINTNSKFVYVTSITSDLDNTKKANVYSINKNIEETVNLLIYGIKGKVADVQENSEDGTVVITTDYELALIYTSEDSETLIQISSRQYVYSSRNSLYRGNDLANRYYRNYYYSRTYNVDKTRYSNLPNGYIDYNDTGVILNDNNKYKIHSNSIRQNSVSSRSSSGHGISPGK